MLIIENREIPLKLEIDVVITTLFHAFVSGLTDANLKEGEFNKKWNPDFVKSLITPDFFEYISDFCYQQVKDVFFDWIWTSGKDKGFIEENFGTFINEYHSMKLRDLLKRFEVDEKWNVFVDEIFNDKSTQLQQTGNYKMKARQNYEHEPSVNATYAITMTVSSAFYGYICGLIISGKDKVIDENSFAAILTWALIDLLNNGELPEKILKEGRPADYRQYFLNLCGGEAELNMLEEMIAIAYYNNIKDIQLKPVDGHFSGSASHYFADVVNRHKNILEDEGE